MSQLRCRGLVKGVKGGMELARNSVGWNVTGSSPSLPNNAYQNCLLSSVRFHYLILLIRYLLKFETEKGKLKIKRLPP